MYTQKTIKAITEVIENGRWSISGYNIGQKSKERLFSESFSRYCNVLYSVPTSNGSSALKIALEALDVGFGDEVIIPVLTWVATATAVTNVNATPIFVDINPDTLCISPTEIKKAITNNTKAIIPVHLYSNMADMDAIMEIAHIYKLKVIEDCSHVHGSEWRNQKAGSIGDIGTFSMQQTKVLTCGEGGVAVTNSQNLAIRMEQLRADSRIFDTSNHSKNVMDLIEKGDIQGTNQNANYLNSLIDTETEISILPIDSRITQVVYYRYLLKIKNYKKHPILELCNKLSKLLNFEITPLYCPLNRNNLFKPSSKSSIVQKNNINYSKQFFVNAEKAYESYISFPHEILLATKKHMEFIAKTLNEELNGS
jgi:dTDP-4-amino-4,6-dideoxygalactose transaminase